MKKIDKTVTINKSKNYFRPILIIVLMFCMLYGLVFKFLRYPSEHTYFLLPTKNTVIIFSMIGVVTCFLVLFVITKTLFRRSTILKIDEQGIFNGFSFYKNKFIKWEEISKIETIRYNHNNYIAIFLKETLNKEKGIYYFLYKMNEKSMGTPHIIFSGDLDCSFEELERLILESYNQRVNKLKS